MKKYLGMSLSIGVIAGIWFFIANSFSLQPWVAYIGWSIFFWEGADWEGAKRSFPCIVLGAVLGVITFYAISSLHPDQTGVLLLSSLMVSLLAFTMTYAQTLPWFKVASATFIGASHYFGLRGYLGATEAFLNAAFVTSVGLLLGMASIALGSTFNRMLGQRE